jgi:hypothetical protein
MIRGTDYRERMRRESMAEVVGFGYSKVLSRDRLLLRAFVTITAEGNLMDWP